MFKTTRQASVALPDSAGPTMPTLWHSPEPPWQVAWSTEHADDLLLLHLHGGFRHRLMLSSEVWFQETLLSRKV